MRENVVSALILIFIFVAGFGLGLIFQGPTNVGLIEEKKEVKVIPVENYKIFSEVKTKLVAVNQNGDGVLTNLTVRAIPGNGRVLVDVESILFWIDTQQSIQIAKKVAEDYIERNITNADITYTIDIPNTTLVGGPSAGAAFAVATIAVIENKTIRNDTVITGTIESDGKIGQVGGIINIASVFGMLGAAPVAAYCAAKAGVINLTKSFAKELAPEILVNCVAPGTIDTEMTRAGGEELIKWISENTPLKRIGNPQEIGKAVLFLASDDSSFITGHTLVVDGGYSLK